jgi:hypothetical protein
MTHLTSERKGAIDVAAVELLSTITLNARFHVTSGPTCHANSQHADCLWVGSLSEGGDTGWNSHVERVSVWIERIELESRVCDVTV